MSDVATTPDGRPIQKIAVLGATGYVGGQLLSLLVGHPQVTVSHATSVHYAGKTLGDVYPSLAPIADQPLTELDVDAINAEADFVISCLPHGEAAELLTPFITGGKRILDLSADFRFSDPKVYETAYGKPHPMPKVTRTAEYGLAELNPKPIARARVVGVPGCYPTAALLALVPLLRRGWVDPEIGVIVDGKSGISGAGREARTGSLFGEVAEGVRAYNVGSHRHQPEMAFQAEALSGTAMPILFTPQVVPMVRGLLATVYFRPPASAPADAGKIRDYLDAVYMDAKGATVLPLGEFPTTKMVAGTNRFAIGVGGLEENGQIVVMCAIDNLIKGAAGQAVQCLNLMLGLDQDLNLPQMGQVV